MSNFKKLSHVLYRCDYHIDTKIQVQGSGMVSETTVRKGYPNVVRMEKL